MKYLHALLIMLIFFLVSCKKEPIDKEPLAPSDFKNIGDWETSVDGILSLRISTNQFTYKPNEVVILKIELKNNSENKIRVSNIIYTLPGCGNTIKIIGQNEITYQGPMKSVCAYPQNILPNAILIKTLQLDLKRWNGFNNKGEYSISYSFSSHPNETDKDLWDGHIKSKPIKIIKE